MRNRARQTDRSALEAEGSLAQIPSSLQLAALYQRKRWSEALCHVWIWAIGDTGAEADTRVVSRAASSLMEISSILSGHRWL